MNVLEADEGGWVFSSHLDSFQGSAGRRDGGVTGNPVGESDLSDFMRIASLWSSRGSVEYHFNSSLFDVLENIPLFFIDLASGFHIEAVLAEIMGCAFSRDQVEAQLLELFNDGNDLRLVLVRSADKNSSFIREMETCAFLGFEEGQGKMSVYSYGFPC